MSKVKKVLGVVLVLGLVFGFSSFSLAEEKGAKKCFMKSLF